MKYSGLLVFGLICGMASAQQTRDLPYYEIPDASETYSAGTVVSRMIDGLGFRFFWATEGLREEDLAFKPSKDARTTGETIDHIYGLTKVILNSALKQSNAASDEGEMSFEAKREKTLKMLQQASKIFKNSQDLSEFTMVFQRGGKTTEYPFWNQINGPIADALWHCGQVITHRRSSGNPFNSKASVLTGKVRN